MIETHKQKTRIQAHHKITDSATQTHTQKQTKAIVRMLFNRPFIHHPHCQAWNGPLQLSHCGPNPKPVCAKTKSLLARQKSQATDPAAKCWYDGSRSRPRSRNVYFSNKSWRNMNNQSLATLVHPVAERDVSNIFLRLRYAWQRTQGEIFFPNWPTIWDEPWALNFW